MANKKAVATGTIQYRSGGTDEKPEFTTVEARDEFSADSKVVEELIENGAAMEPKAFEAVQDAKADAAGEDSAPA